MKLRSFLFLVLYLIALRGFAQVSEDNIRVYINKYKSIALEQEQEYGIPAPVTLAQGILESAAGTSWLTQHSNNHFGIKRGGSWTGKCVYAWDDEKKPSAFRQYRSAEESYRDHSRILTANSRYAFLFSKSVFDYRNRTDYSEAIEYTAYNGDDPVLIRYDDYAGHLGYQFEEGEMTTIIIRFAQTPAKRDPKMNYGGVKNDADLIYDQLYEELDFLLSAYDDIEKHESESDTIRTTSWSSNTEIQDGFITRLSLQEISDPHDPENKQTLLYIFRIKFENGIWTSRNH